MVSIVAAEARVSLTQNMRQIQYETSSAATGTPLAVSRVVHGLPDPNGEGRRLLFGQVPLPELLVPGPRLYPTCSQLFLGVGIRLQLPGAIFLHNSCLYKKIG